MRAVRGISRLLTAVAVAVTLVGCGPGSPGASGSRSGIGTIKVTDLPAEARTTLRLIAQGGPYPFRTDGVTFQNREHRLPAEPSGYYREFTVLTPGAGDRGARRIIAGKDGQRFYTADHYLTFKIIEGA